MATYYVDLPSDYLHLLNCICIYNVKKTYKCYNKGDTWRAAATRLTADAYSQILDNFWNQPTYKKPYFYLHNINTNNVIPTNPYDNNNKAGTDKSFEDSSFTRLIGKAKVDGDQGEYPIQLYGYYEHEEAFENPYYKINGGDPITVKKGMIFELPLHIDDKYIMFTENGWQNSKEIWDFVNQCAKGNPIAINDNSTLFSSTETQYGVNISNIERTAQVRYGNPSKVRMEIRYGTDNSVFTLDEVSGGKGGKIYIDYLKAPQHIRLTQAELDRTEDTSQVLEFPDYVCQEILNELVTIIMENIGDPHLQTHPVVSQSIANPTQAQAPVAAGQTA